MAKTARTPGPYVAHIQSSGHGDGLYDAKVCICTYKENPNVAYDSPVAKQVAWTVGSYFTYGSEEYKRDVAQNIADAQYLVEAANKYEALTAECDKQQARAMKAEMDVAYHQEQRTLQGKDFFAMEKQRDELLAALKSLRTRSDVDGFAKAIVEKAIANTEAA